MNKPLFILISIVFTSKILLAQVVTPEDSLTSGLVAGTQKTIFSGYGEAYASFDLKQKDAEANLERVVLFVGHKFSSHISLFTEMELEDALVAGEIEGKKGSGEISMEQAFVKFDLNPSHYIVAGLFTPRIGIINENHLPTTFNGIERPYVEQLIIPSTWRGLGIGYYGSMNKIRGLNYSLSITNGLNSEGFENGSGIKEGRQQGSKTKGIGAMVNGALLYYINNFRIQFSSTFSGTSAVEKQRSDTLRLHHGVFANPVFLNEMNVQYRNKGFEIKTLVCVMNISGAQNINHAFNNNTPSQLFGAYAEVGYNILYKPKINAYDNRMLILFARAEYLDLNQHIAENGVVNNANKKMYLLGGLTYKPLRGVSIKFDYTQQTTGKQNIISPSIEPYHTNKGFLNFGLGYNF